MDKYVYDYLNTIESFYSAFFDLTPEILDKKINEVNYIFSDFYYCAAHLVKAYKLEDSFLCMDLANKIYFNKLGGLSENFKESNNFLNKLDEKARLENYNE